jgi:hypothetical protein
VAVAGDYAYIAGDSGLRVIDVSDPVNPVEVGFHSTPDVARAVAATDDFVYVSGGGLSIFSFIPPHQVSGSVALPNGAPLPDVTISAGLGAEAMTNVSGVYTITDLVSGTYTLTPTLASYTFAPPTRTVTVPPDATGQDFIAYPTPLQAVDIGGPVSGTVGTTYWYTATAGPPTSTRPVTYTWQASGQLPVTHTHQYTLTDWLSYTWDVGGGKVITVTATNLGAAVTDTHEIWLYTPPQASFTAVPTSGLAPLSVTFTNTSTGDFHTSLWAFGDGIISTLQHPSHLYTTGSTYTVILTVEGPGGTDNETKPGYIAVQYGFYLPLILRAA